jgi:hypothetical protein
MNTSAQVGAFASSLTFGFLVERYSDYSLPFVPMALMLLAGAAFWLKVDPTKQLAGTASTEAMGGAPVSA